MEHSPLFLKIISEARQAVKETRIGELKRRLPPKDFHLIDVREDGEWEAGRIPGAVHIGRGVLERDIEKTVPDLGAEIVLYCGGGFRSALAAESLQRMGYRKVLSLAEGWRGWKEAGGETEK